MLRPPWIIWRSTGAEVTRTLALSALALVSLIAFVGAVRPLAEGKIGLADALRLTALLTIPMLQFALPFAAGFAATLGFHRAASENEASAAHSAGISHLALLTPAFAIGIALAGIVWFLANNAMPLFLERAEQIVQRDLVRIMLTPLERGEPVRFGDYDIHADRAVGPLELPPGSAARAHIVLFGVIAVENSAGPGVTCHAAERVDLWLFDDPDDSAHTIVQFVFTGATSMTKTGTVTLQSQPTLRLRIPRSVADDPKFLSLRELLALRADPGRSPAIANRLRTLAMHTAEIEMVHTIATTLASAGAVTASLPEGSITIAGARAMPNKDGAILTPASDAAPITVVIRVTRPNDDRVTTRTEQALSGALRPLNQKDDAQSLAVDPLLTLELHDVTTIVTDSHGPESRADSRSYSALSPDDFDAAPIFALPAGALLDRAAANPALASEADEARSRINRLIREIDSKIHERAAYSIACCVMVVLGGVMALRLKDAMLLPVYLWSFLPALAAVISISAGQGIAHEQGLIGFIILWAGVTALAAVTFTQYVALRRH